MGESKKTKQQLMAEITRLRNCVAESMTEITCRKQTEEELRKSAANYRSLAATIDTLFLIDRNYVMILANEHFLRRLGPYNAGPMIGESIDTIHHPSQAINIRKGVDMVFATGKPYYDEFLGHYTPMYFIRTFSPVFDENGEVTSVTVAAKDMTKRKLVELELQQSEEKYRSLASIADRSFVVDKDCRYLFANENYLELFGPQEDSIIGRKYGEFHREERARVVADTVQYVIETGNVFQGEHVGVRRNLHFLQKFSPIRNVDGSVYAVTVVSIDITERKRAEQALRNSLQEKELLLKEVHHRVKNNLQVISSLFNLQTSASGSPETTELFNTCRRRIRSMALIHEKLYESDDLGRINLATYAQGLAKELMQSYARSPEKIALIVAARNVYTDIDKAIPCGLILNELIANALKHAFPEDASGKIWIEISESKDREIRIVIRDNGSGLPEDFLPCQSSGVGFYLVTGLVKNQLGGKLAVARNDGAEIEFTFPA